MCRVANNPTLPMRDSATIFGSVSERPSAEELDVGEVEVLVPALPDAHRGGVLFVQALPIRASG
jgi:hypothetical protein